MRNSDIVVLSDVLVIGSGFASDSRACLFCGDCILSGESTCFTCPNLFLRRLRSVCVGDVAVFRGFSCCRAKVKVFTWIWIWSAAGFKVLSYCWEKVKVFTRRLLKRARPVEHPLVFLFLGLVFVWIRLSLRFSFFFLAIFLCVFSSSLFPRQPPDVCHFCCGLEDQRDEWF